MHEKDVKYFYNLTFYSSWQNETEQCIERDKGRVDSDGFDDPQMLLSAVKVEIQEYNEEYVSSLFIFLIND